MSRLIDLASAFHKKSMSYISHCKKADVLLTKGSLTSTHCNLIYEATLISSVAQFERTLEDMLVEMIFGKKGTLADNRSHMVVRSRDSIRKIITGRGDYAAFWPLKKAQEAASLYLVGAEPFTLAAQGEGSTLADVNRVRNAIAHRSKFSLGEFQNKVAGVNQMSPNRRYPGQYLRSVFRSVPDQTRHDLFLSTLIKILRAVPSNW